MATSKVTDRGQVTIPKSLRQRLGIRTGELLDFEEGPGGSLVARKAADLDPVDAVYGIIDLDQPADEWIESIRGPVDAV